MSELIKAGERALQWFDSFIRLTHESTAIHDTAKECREGIKAAIESVKASHHASNNKAQIIIAEQQRRIWELEKALQDRSNG